MKSGPRLPQLEKALAQKRRPNIVINQSINKSLKKKKYLFFVLARLMILTGKLTHNKGRILVVTRHESLQPRHRSLGMVKIDTLPTTINHWNNPLSRRGCQL